MGELTPFDKIMRFEQMLLELPQVDFKTQHEFCDGIYARTIHIPRGVALTGAIHRHENFLVVRSGDITVWTENGMRRVQGGAMIMSFAGIKRVGYAHEDTIITTFHSNIGNETDPETLWELFACETMAEVDFNVTLEIGA